MPRWRQDSKTGKLIPIDEAAKRHSGGIFVRPEVDPFVSPVDGTVIDSRRKLEEHNKRNNVVSSSEFSPEYYARKAEERARVFRGEHTPQESFRRKQEIYELLVRAERNGS